MTYVKTRPRTLRSRAVVAGLWLACVAAAVQAQDQPQDLPVVALTAGMHKIRAQVARTPAQRQTGLMFRRDMPANDGMLFVFEQALPQCFWMKNTPLPLAIAFIADDGSIVNVDEMQPQTLDSHCSTKPVRYVLEMNKGWFAARGVKAGAKIGGEVLTRPN
jgi:uncharacterized protein